MNPDLDLRLKSVLKALTDVILPALPADERMAREQARLAGLVAGQPKRQRRTVNGLLERDRRLGLEVVALAGSRLTWATAATATEPEATPATTPGTPSAPLATATASPSFAAPT